MLFCFVFEYYSNISVFLIMQYEWSTVAEPLSQHGYLAVVINLHGGQKKLVSNEMVDLISEHIVKNHFKRDKYILMGK
jgi:hypothetical protein